MTRIDAKDALRNAVERVAAMCRAFGVESLAPQVAACEELLRGGGVVDVAVLGQFKAGKSSFLNGLTRSGPVGRRRGKSHRWPGAGRLGVPRPGAVHDRGTGRRFRFRRDPGGGNPRCPGGAFFARIRDILIF